MIPGFLLNIKAPDDIQGFSFSNTA